MELRRGRQTDIDECIAFVAETATEGDERATVDWWVERLGAEGVERVDGVDVPVVIAGRDRDRSAEGVAVVGLDSPRGGDDGPSTGRIHWLSVATGARRQGHGRRLLVTAERVLAAAGCSQAVLEAPATPDLDLFLTSMGWQSGPDGGPNGNTTWQRDLLGDDSSHVAANRLAWDEDADRWIEAGRRAYAPERRRNPNWGCWAIPEPEVGMLQGIEGAHVIELGCGTGYVSAWCQEAGAASVVGLDNSPRQLATARVLQGEHGLRFPLVWADAERAPFPDASFDFAISEYGAAIWCDPYRWIPEAARLLRPGGRLAFLANSVVSMLCANEFELDDGPATDVMRRPQRGMHRFAWYDNLGVEFHIDHGNMIRLLRNSGFEILDLVELFIPPDAESPFTFVDGAFGSKWPVEEVWLARRTG